MNSRELFHAASEGKKTPRAPFWIMRQAGRYLPEYRKLKEKHGFLEIVKTPELALEVALQPMRRFDFDCAIVFSDILVVSEALGFSYNFKDGGGIALERTVKCESDVENMPPAEIVREKLKYVIDAIKLLRSALPDKAILGFCASSFTLGAYMFEGTSKNNFEGYKNFAKNDTKVFEKFLNKLDEALIEYVKMQAEAGIDALQIFDSNASLSTSGEYANMSALHSKKLTDTLREKDVKSILYAKGMNFRFEELLSADTDIYSVDSSRALAELKNLCGKRYALQGNLSEDLLGKSSPQNVREKTLEILNSLEGSHILNLGHGIKPDAKIENVEAFANTAKEFKYL